MSESRSPADSIVDLLVYLPLGAALAAKEMAPELSRKGRRLVQDRLTSARLIGELTVRSLERAGGGLLGNGRTAGGSEPVAATASSAPSPPTVPADAPVANAGARARTATADAAHNPTPGPGPEALAIPGYDTLSAFQVVQRLEGLSQAELDAVRAHEQAGRKRQTVLNRIAQLSAAS